MLLSSYAASGKKKPTFTRNRELHNFNIISNDQFKINKIIDKLLLTGDKFIPELHLKQPRLTFSACGPFTKHRKRIQRFRETGDLKHLYRIELDIVCFKYLAKRTVLDKILKDKPYERSMRDLKTIFEQHI